MAGWRDNGRVIIPRELRRFAGSRRLPGGPLQIIRVAGDRYEVFYRGMRITFADHRGLVGGVMWPEQGRQQTAGRGPYRRSAKQSAAFERYRSARTETMLDGAAVSALSVLEFSEEHDVRAFVIYGSYVQAVRSMLALAQVSKDHADELQRGQGYVCFDQHDRLPLELG
ncbi:MAG: hypothetical protein JRI23_23080 [Deltaproteobacteria bacterium]|jgi:hypothetical protein|nr:hypothetical protein [Deltaproteobacteria bacterium]MBW2534856.1 hypothetical protein [Deltaproteobacteria bacterium]